jgi:hypothetical protein
MKMIATLTRKKFGPMALGLALGCAGASSATAADTTNATPPGPSVTGRRAHENFWKRFDEANMEALGSPSNPPPDTNAPPSKRKGMPAPFDSPPYPNGEWQIGGTEIIGDQNLTPDYPLMQAIYDGPHGQAWRDSHIKFYGWEDFSGNVSTSHQGAGANVPGGNSGINPVNSQGANFPEVYDQRPNRLEQNQFVLYAERTPDESGDKIDWGFRMSWVYGLDYRYMISRGWDDHQLTTRNNFDGMDDPMMYFNLYLPHIFDGCNLTLGRIISEADIEAQLAPNNLMSSHSLLYGFDPYCQWGLFSTFKLNKNWQVQLGVSAGNDVTPWETQDPGTQPTGSIMVQWQSSDGHWGFYGGDNAFNNAHWGFNNIQQEVATLTYKFNDRVWTSHETWFMFQDQCPGQFSSTGTALPTGQGQNIHEPYTDGQVPVHPGWSHEWATLNYTMFRIYPNLFFTVRNELFDDCQGQRTGYATLYDEHSIGFTWWPSSIITVRPELRYEHSCGTHGGQGGPTPGIDEAKPYDDGTRRQQWTAQMDIIYHF